MKKWVPKLRSFRTRGLWGKKRSTKIWTRSQRIRTVAETPFEVALLDTVPPPLYQRIAREAAQLEQLGLNRHRIARRLGVADKTVTKAIAWHRKLTMPGQHDRHRLS